MSTATFDSKNGSIRLDTLTFNGSFNVDELKAYHEKKETLKEQSCKFNITKTKSGAYFASSSSPVEIDDTSFYIILTFDPTGKLLGLDLRPSTDHIGYPDDKSQNLNAKISNSWLEKELGKGTVQEDYLTEYKTDSFYARVAIDHRNFMGGNIEFIYEEE